MRCPFCGEETGVIETRGNESGDVRRRRSCKACGERFTTFERISPENMRVSKRDGSVEQFSRDKLRRGIGKAMVGRKLSPADVNAYVNRVIQVLQPDAANAPVPSTRIGDLVLQQLHHDARTSIIRIRYAMVLLGRTDAKRHGFRRLADFLNWLREEYEESRVAKPSRTPAVVIKRDGKREPFELEKLARSIGVAAKGRGTDDKVRQLANRVAAAVQRELRGQSIVTYGQIAAETMKALLTEDPLAYLRYASAVKRYQSVDDFWLDAFGLEEQ